MPKTGKPFSSPLDRGLDNDPPVALPDLLSGLVNRAGWQEDGLDNALTPEVMAPEDPMPPATPVNATMPEFLASLRTLLAAHEDGDRLLAGGSPPEAVQDFAHGTNELLNYLLHEVVGSAAPSAEEHPTEAVQDFADATSQLLTHLLSEVAEPAVEHDETYPPEAMADFLNGTHDLLGQLLAMADQEAVPQALEANPFESVKNTLLGGLMASVDNAPPADECDVEPVIDIQVPEAIASSATLPVGDPGPEQPSFDLDQLRDLLAATVSFDPPLLAEEPTVDDAMTRGLLSGLLSNLTGNPERNAPHNLGEAPRGYMDESDDEEGLERPAGAFELLLDAIDSELPPPPRIRGIQQPLANTVQGERFLAFDLAGESYALPFECVLETDRVPRWTHVPGLPGHLRGVFNRRGEIIPLVDLRALFGIGASATEGRMLVIRDRAAKAPLAFVVDRLLGLASLPPDAVVRSHPGILRGIATTGGRKVGVLDPDRVTAAAHGASPVPRSTIHTYQLLEEETYV